MISLSDPLLSQRHWNTETQSGSHWRDIRAVLVSLSHPDKRDRLASALRIAERPAYPCRLGPVAQVVRAHP